MQTIRQREAHLVLLVDPLINLQHKFLLNENLIRHRLARDFVTFHFKYLCNGNWVAN